MVAGAEDSPNAVRHSTNVEERKSGKIETWLVKPSRHVVESEFREKWRELNWGPPLVEFSFLPGGIIQAHVHCAPGVNWDPVELFKALDGTLRNASASVREVSAINRNSVRL